MFAPLYLSNYCVNGCVYCPYHHQNKHIARKKLTQEEIRKEVIALQDMGHKRFLPWKPEKIRSTTPSNIFWSASRPSTPSTIRTAPSAASTSTSPPLPRKKYKMLKDAGIGTYILFQETYHKDSYEKLHPTGPKHNYAWHTEAMDRAMEAGIDDVGLGVLFGLKCTATNWQAC